jgi:hypothetical protein
VNAKDKELLTRADETMEFTLRNYVLAQHQTAQNARTKSAQAGAKEGYVLYLRTFKSSPKIDEMHFFYGELLFDLNDYLAAAKRYEWVIQNSPRSPYFDKSLLNSLLSYEKLLPKPEEIKKVVGTKNIDPVEFSENIKAFEVAALRYLERVPKGENRTAIKFRIASLYYYFNQFDPAEKLFREIIATDSKSEYAKHSANLMLDIYNLKKDYVGLQKAADDIMKVPSLANSDVGAQIKDIRVQSAFKNAKDLESKNDYAASAEQFEAFSLKNAGTTLGFTALYNATVNYGRAGDTNKALELSTKVIAAKGGDEKAKKDTFRGLPGLYETTGQYIKAAKYYEAYAGKYPKENISTQYYLNAAIIFDGMSSYNNAKRNYEQYMARARGSEKFDTLFFLGKLYERMRSWSKARLYYDQFIKSGTKNALAIVESAFLIAKIHEIQGNKKFAKEWYEKTVYTQRSLAKSGQPAGATFAAEAKFKLVESIYVELVSFRIPASGKAQKNAVDRKLGLIQKLKDELKSVVAYDDAFQIVAALNLQGKALEHMYKSILAVPTPKGLNPEELKQYQEGVKQLYEPFRLQAIETYELSIKKGKELQAYSDPLRESIASLSELNGQSQPAARAEVMQVELTDRMGLK